MCGEFTWQFVVLNSFPLKTVFCLIQNYFQRPETPGVYAQVDAYIDWIDEQICKYSCFPPDTCDPAMSEAECEEDPFPGAFPSDGQMMINVFTDEYPQETSWLLEAYDATTDSWNFEGAGTFESELTLHSVATAASPDTYYRLAFSDSFGDGFCCRDGQGWYGVNANRFGVEYEVVSSIADFASSREVYLYVDATGFVSTTT